MQLTRTKLVTTIQNVPFETRTDQFPRKMMLPVSLCLLTYLLLLVLSKDQPDVRRFNLGGYSFIRFFFLWKTSRERSSSLLYLFELHPLIWMHANDFFFFKYVMYIMYLLNLMLSGFSFPYLKCNNMELIMKNIYGYLFTQMN